MATKSAAIYRIHPSNPFIASVINCIECPSTILKLDAIFRQKVSSRSEIILPYIRSQKLEQSREVIVLHQYSYCSTASMVPIEEDSIMMQEGMYSVIGVI